MLFCICIAYGRLVIRTGTKAYNYQKYNCISFHDKVFKKTANGRRNRWLVFLLFRYLYSITKAAICHRSRSRQKYNTRTVIIRYQD